MLSIGLKSIGSSSLQVHKMKVNFEISLILYYKHSFFRKCFNLVSKWFIGFNLHWYHITEFSAQ